MQRLWAPWRIGYIKEQKPSGCVFCQEGEDRELLILQRTPHCRVLLNRYPYCNGHLLVATRRHTVDLDGLTDPEMLDLFRSVALCRRVLEASMQPDGFNIGVNLGKVAGAGVDDHLHFHVVPRWSGDSNFIATIAETRVLPEALLACYDRLLPLFAARGGD